MNANVNANQFNSLVTFESDECKTDRRTKIPSAISHSVSVIIFPEAERRQVCNDFFALVDFLIKPTKIQVEMSRFYSR